MSSANRTQGKVAGYRFCCYRCDLDRKSAHEIARHWKEGKHSGQGDFNRELIWTYRDTNLKNTATPVNPQLYQRPIPSYRTWLASLTATTAPATTLPAITLPAAAPGPDVTNTTNSQTRASSTSGRVTRTRSNSQQASKRSRARSQTTATSAPGISASAEPTISSNPTRTNRRKRQASEIDLSSDDTDAPPATTSKRPKLTLKMPTITEANDENEPSSSKTTEKTADASKTASTDTTEPATEETVEPWQRKSHSKKKGPPQVSAEHIRKKIAEKDNKGTNTTSALETTPESPVQIDGGPSAKAKGKRKRTIDVDDDSDDESSSPSPNKRRRTSPVSQARRPRYINTTTRRSGRLNNAFVEPERDDNPGPARVPEYPQLATNQVNIQTAYDRATDLTAGRGLERTRMPKTTEMARQSLMGILPPKVADAWNKKFTPLAATMLAYTAAYDKLVEQNEYVEHLQMLQDSQAEEIDRLRSRNAELERQSRRPNVAEAEPEQEVEHEGSNQELQQESMHLDVTEGPCCG